MSTWLNRYATFLLMVILCFAFVTRLYRLHEPDAYVFDEVYHAVTAKLIHRNDPRAYEWWNPAPEPNTAVDWLHPPLAKYTQALAMSAFGETSFGWRISSAIFGLLVIAMTYSLAKEVFASEGIALGSAALASLDGLLLTQSRVAMNDIHVTFFILLTLTWYTKYRKTDQLRWLWLTGLGAGLAMASKWSGLFVIGVVGLFETLRFIKSTWAIRHKQKVSESIQRLASFVGLRFIILLALPFALYVLSYTHMFLQGKTLVCTQQQPIQGECYLDIVERNDGSSYQRYISHFHELHQQIWWYQTNLKATHDYQSRPWQWFLNLKPVWFHVEYGDNNQIANIYALSNPALAWIGAATVFITLFWLLQQALTRLSTLTSQPVKKVKEIANHSLPRVVFIFVSYLTVWLPWQASPRIMFFYHYTPAIPLLSILVAYWFNRLWNLHRSATKVTKAVRQRQSHQLTNQQLLTELSQLTWNQSAVILLFALIAITFIVWYPHWTGISVNTDFANTVYFAPRSWK